jgi:hypothetical protein
VSIASCTAEAALRARSLFNPVAAGRPLARRIDERGPGRWVEVVGVVDRH